MNETDQDDRALLLFEHMRQKPLGELWEIIAQGGSDEKHAAAMELQSRGGDTNFQKALEFCRSPDPLVRDKGAFILGQLGTPERPYSEQSAPVLINLLENDPDEGVRASAAYALGHLGNPIAVPQLLVNTKHRSAEIRLGVAFALCSFDGQNVVDALITLSSDSDRDVRDWATAGLGTFLELDSPQIRDALVVRLSEDDAEIRGEALIGLARRGDERVVDPLKRELSGEFYGGWCLEAAELMADPALHPLLVSLRTRIESEVEDRFIHELEQALAACKP